MTTHKNRLKRIAAGATAIGLVASVGLLGNGVDAAPGNAQNGLGTGLFLSQTSGTSSDFFDIELLDPGSQICPPDSVTGNPGTANENFRASSFIIPATSDPEALTYANPAFGAGYADDGNGTAYPLFANTGPAVNSLPAAPNGNINLNDFDSISFNNPAGQAIAALGAGDYFLGIGCWDGDTAGQPSERFWATPIEVFNVSGNTFEWTTVALPDVAEAPVLDSAVLASGDIVVDWTAGPSNPADDSYTVTATSASAPTVTATVTAPTTTATLTGLVLGAEYSVSVVATNAEGDSAPSNSIDVLIQPDPPRNVVAAPGSSAGEALVTFDAPSSGTPVGYVVSITPADAADVNVPAAGALEAVFAGLTPGTQYTARVTADLGGGVTSFADSGAFTVNNAQVLVQEIEVTRPVGALVLTQRCGVYGGLPAFSAVDAFPGFPRDLSTFGNPVAGPGTSPDITPDGNDPQQDDDPEFGNYPIPNPATYPTECGIQLGTAALVTSGALAGQYYTADGRLNQVTVVDTRDTDDGWTINGSVEDFASGTDTFDGDYLGWQPLVTSDSDPAAPGGYDQVVTAGPGVLPGTGITSGSGLSSAQVLASAPVNQGLGIAELDARIQLLIPTEAPAGDYSATLSLTAV